MKFDAIIIGSGIGGLLAGAHLSQLGKMVLIIEKLGFIGGRFTSRNYKGYQVPTGAVYLIPHGSKGPFAKIINNLNIKTKIVDCDIFGSFLLGDKHKTIRDIPEIYKLFNLKELFTVIKLIILLKLKKEIEEINFGDWLKANAKNQKIYSIFEKFSQFSISISLKDISYNEMRAVMKNVRRLKQSGFIEGGFLNLINNIKTLIERNGSIISIRTQATKIISKNGKVIGIIAYNQKEKKEKIYYSDLIISNCGPKITADLIEENDNKIQNFCHKLRGIKEAKGLKINFASNKSLIAHNSIMFCPYAQRIAGIVQPSNFIKNVAPKGMHLLISYHVPNNDNINEEKKIAIKDIENIFGKKIKDSLQILSINYYSNGWPTNRALQGTDLNTKTPLAGLYMVGDACKPSGYLMVEGVAKSVENLINEIDQNFNMI